MMKVLAFDTSTKFLSIALLEDNEPKAVFHEDVGIRHSEILVPTINDLLNKISWDLKDIELMCVGLGPGSFTGLRIAVATIKGFAAVLRNKVVGVPTMDAIAMNYSGEKKLIAPLLDARKGKVYSCIYERSGGEVKKTTDDLLITIDELLENLDKKVMFFGDAVSKYSDKLDNNSFAGYDKNIDWYPRAVNIARLGVKKAHSGVDDPEVIDPLYLHAKECQIRDHE